MVAFARPLASDITEEERKKARTYISLIHDLLPKLFDILIMSPFPSIEESSQQRMHAMQDELMQMQLKYQREIERLEKENKELRKQILLRGSQKFNNKKIKVIYIYIVYI